MVLVGGMEVAEEAPLVTVKGLVVELVVLMVGWLVLLLGLTAIATLSNPITRWFGGRWTQQHGQMVMVVVAVAVQSS